MITFDDIIGSNTKNNILAYSDQIYHSSKNRSIESIIDDLYTWGCIGIIPSFNNVIKLTTSSTSSDIIDTLRIKDITNVTNVANVATTTIITDASKINDILNRCTVYGKWLIENNYRAVVRVEWLNSFFILSTIRNAAYLNSNSEIDYQPVIDSIALQYDSSTNTLKVARNPKRYNLYLCNNVTTSTT